MAPVAAPGCPREMPLPFGLVRSGGRPNSLTTASAWAAKASFTSNTSISSILIPVRSSRVRTAGTGPMPMMRGSTPACAYPISLPIGTRPLLRTHDSEASTTAAAASLMPPGVVAREYLLLEVAARLRGRGPAMALRGQDVLVGPGHVKVGGDVLRRHAHVASVERIGERAGHGVDGGAVAHPLAPAHAGQPVRGATHRLGAPGYRHLAVTQHDGLRGGHNGLQPAAAQPVNGERRG